MQPIKKICVCGAGTMGTGIAQVVAQSGFDVILFDVNNQAFLKSKASIENGLQKLAAKGKISGGQKNETLQRVTFTSDIHNCVADIIIEAVAENAAIKEQLFDKLALLNDDNAIFATNTSSIPLSVLSRAKTYASQLAGLHFFNPAPVMKLVEIIRSEKTAESIIKTLVDFAKKLGKTAVVCKDSPGFIVNRIARPYYLEALRLLENNVADAATIDEVMEATGFKMGPFKLIDLIGMDVNYSVSNIVWEALGKPGRLTPSAIQKEKAEANELGRKTGKGFYNY